VMSETSDAVDPHQRQRRRSLITIGVVLLGLFFAFWYAWSYYQAETEAVAARLPAARDAAARWWELARTFGIPPKALALRYALTLDAPLVVGAESPEQVAETARLAAILKPLSPEEVQALATAMDPVLNEIILEPWRWKPRSS